MLDLSPSVRELLLVCRFNNTKTDSVTDSSHSERRIKQFLDDLDVPWTNLVALYTERPPCSPKRANCQALVAQMNAKVFRSFEGPKPHFEITEELEKALKKYTKTSSTTLAPRPPRSAWNGSAVAQARSPATASAPRATTHCPDPW